MHSRAAWALGLGLLACVTTIPAVARAQVIGIKSADCGSCGIRVVAGAPFSFFIYVDMEGAAPGFAGASFMIEGMPEGIFGQITIIDFFGIPCDPGGCTVFGPPGIGLGYPTCQTEPCRSIIRFDGITFSTPPENTELRVVTRSPDVDGLGCPVINLCDGPTFTRICARGGVGYMNSTGDCPVLAVESETWSGIKSFYD